MADNQINLAAITGAHGIHGEVRLKLLGEGIAALRQHAGFSDVALTLEKVRPDNKGGAIARFVEVRDRTEAERLRGTVLTVPREALPPLEADEYYHADLIGLVVETDRGEKVGRVIAVENYGATDIVEIERDPPPAKGMKTFMVPMTKAAVLRWNAETLVIAGDFVE